MDVWDQIIKERQDHSQEHHKGKKSCEISKIKKCPNCHQAALEYNGLLNLVCPKCGYEIAAGFT